MKNDIKYRVFCVSTKDMYFMYMDCMRDVIWEDKTCGIDTEVIEVIRNGDIEGIRSLFMNGMTAFLVDMDEIDSVENEGVNILIDIYHEDKSIGVINDNEIVY